MDSIWRIKCREYSIKFHTPLHVVINDLDPMHVLESLYEDQYHPSIVDEELEELLEKLEKIRDPSYNRMSREEVEALVDSVLQKEIDRKAKKKAPTQQQVEREASIPTPPKSGSMDFGSLERLESASETNKAGFDEEDQ